MMKTLPRRRRSTRTLYSPQSRLCFRHPLPRPSVLLRRRLDEIRVVVDRIFPIAHAQTPSLQLTSARLLPTVQPPPCRHHAPRFPSRRRFLHTHPSPRRMLFRSIRISRMGTEGKVQTHLRYRLRSVRLLFVEGRFRRLVPFPPPPQLSQAQLFSQRTALIPPIS